MQQGLQTIQSPVVVEWILQEGFPPHLDQLETEASIKLLSLAPQKRLPLLPLHLAGPLS